MSDRSKTFNLEHQNQMAVQAPGHPGIHVRCVHPRVFQHGTEYMYVWCKPGRDGGAYPAERVSKIISGDVTKLKVPWHASLAKAQAWALAFPYEPPTLPTPDHG